MYVCHAGRRILVSFQGVIKVVKQCTPACSCARTHLPEQGLRDDVTLAALLRHVCEQIACRVLQALPVKFAPDRVVCVLALFI
jgi:hypothetical protein